MCKCLILVKYAADKRDCICCIAIMLSGWIWHFMESNKRKRAFVDKMRRKKRSTHEYCPNWMEWECEIIRETGYRWKNTYNGSLFSSTVFLRLSSFSLSFVDAKVNVAFQLQMWMVWMERNDTGGKEEENSGRMKRGRVDRKEGMAINSKIEIKGDVKKGHQ